MRPDTTVVAIGASIGDTPIYFAQFDKVRKVIGYEPDPKRFAQAVHNVKESPFSSRITLSKDIVSNQGEKVFGTYNNVLKQAVGMGAKLEQSTAC